MKCPKCGHELTPKEMRYEIEKLQKQAIIAMQFAKKTKLEKDLLVTIRSMQVIIDELNKMSDTT